MGKKAHELELASEDQGGEPICNISIAQGVNLFELTTYPIHIMVMCIVYLGATITARGLALD